MVRKALFYHIQRFLNGHDRDVYEFGIWTGGAMLAIQSLLIDLHKIPSTVRCFDSFDGLPHDKTKWTNAERAHYKGNPVNMWNAMTSLKVSTPEEAKAILAQKVDPRVHTEFVTGWFNESLDAAYRSTWKPATYVDVDVDLYCSAKVLLDFMYQRKLIVPGTVIYYDDWAATPEFEGGESRAHLETTKEYNVKCELIHNWHAVDKFNTHHATKTFVVRSIG